MPLLAPEKTGTILAELQRSATPSVFGDLMCMDERYVYAISDGRRGDVGGEVAKDGLGHVSRGHIQTPCCQM
jgi:hypothetical protein